MWKPMHEQITPKEHEIAWVEYIIGPRIRLKIGASIPTYNIILLILFDKDHSNIVVCTL
jgi:hypothetical protein